MVSASPQETFHKSTKISNIGRFLTCSNRIAPRSKIDAQNVDRQIRMTQANVNIEAPCFRPAHVKPFFVIETLVLLLQGFIEKKRLFMLVHSAGIYGRRGQEGTSGIKPLNHRPRTVRAGVRWAGTSIGADGREGPFHFAVAFRRWQCR